MHGHLTATSLADVCRELAEARATGVLHVTGHEAAGRLVFDQGRLVAAASPTPGSRLGDRLINAGLLAEEALERVLRDQDAAAHHDRARLGRLLVDRGLVPPDAVRLVIQEQLLDAVLDLTGWRQGTFRFEPDAEAATPEIPLAVTVDQALIEVARRREEWEALTDVIPDLDAVPRFVEGTSASGASLDPDEFAVMASLDGVRSVRDLAYDLGYGEFEAARVVYALSLLGLVEVRPPRDEIGAALDDALAYVGERGSGEPAEASPPPARAGEGPDVADPADDAVPAPAPADDTETAGDEPALWSSWEMDLEAAAARDEPEPASTDDTPADDTPADDAAPPPGADRGPDTLEADLPDLSGFEELRLADRQPAGEPEADAPGPGPGDGAQATPPAAEKPPAAPPPTEDPPAADPYRRPAGADGDVSEFLRELSRLALDDEEDEEEPPADSPAPGTGEERSSPPPSPRASEPREEPRRRKRGLFGFGG